MKFNTPADWLSWLENLHPFSIEMGLGRVGEVWSRLCNSQIPYTVITVGGTNGKGSTVAMLEAVYSAAGYRTGAYSSPHLLRFNERIRMQGMEVEDQPLCQAFDAVEKARGDISLTYFEFTTLAAFYLFLQQQPDVVILEVGLGGRLDAVNIIDPDVSVITSIALDHQAWLGDDIEQIAREKAGIMRRDRPTVFAGKQPPLSLLEVAEEVGAKLLVRDRDFFVQQQESGWSLKIGDRTWPALPVPGLRGRHQLTNAAAAVAVVELLSDRLPVSAADVRKGLDEATVSGRFQVIPGDVLHILDVGHNPEAAKSFSDNLADMFCSGTTYAVFGILDDKDLEGVLRPLMKRVDIWCIAPPDTPRALSTEQMSAVLKGYGAEVETYETLSRAYGHCRDKAEQGDRILVFGSFFTVAEVLPLIHSN